MRHEIGSAAPFPQNAPVKKERLWLPIMVVAAGTLIFAGLLAGLPTHALIAASTLLSVFVLGYTLVAFMRGRQRMKATLALIAKIEARLLRERRPPGPRL